MKAERKKRPLWKRIVWGVGIVLGALVLAFAGISSASPNRIA